ncbi:putative DNA repair and recombination protein RAD54B [Paratrimastix pyriformis]|uniref:DNA repair and recombination protein RAD54B n=1 Tax=Paratrimastix pyriformis TaxID=342808 RepID=A0ABQ8UK43_9EUKA|nr:putative DNA repair and recombination protein RAD54B [Paratrimastix pyriformis]
MKRSNCPSQRGKGTFVSPLLNRPLPSPPPIKLSTPPVVSQPQSASAVQATPSPSHAADQTAEPTLLIFRVMHTKSSAKKHKVYDDGVVTLKGRSCALYDMEGKVVAKSMVTFPPETLHEGNTIYFGGKEAEVLCPVPAEDFTSGSIFIGTGAPTKAAPAKPRAKLLPFKRVAGPDPSPAASGDSTAPVARAAPRVRPLHDPAAPGAIVLNPGRPEHTDSGRTIVPVVVDPVLGRLLDPHQVAGVRFMYDCVTDRTPDGSGQAGCILADEMGLGKTLQALTLMWTLLKQGPSRSLAASGGPHSDLNVGVRVGAVPAIEMIHDFATGPVYRVLVVTYEQVRAHIDRLLEAPSGHRLKNSEAKTTKALASFPTRRRVMLSGTPVQNDLEEFWTMCNFVQPDALGSQLAFKRLFERPIAAARDSRALTLRTGRFVLRRTTDVLKLPPKHECVLFCRPSPLQAALYREATRAQAGDLNSARALMLATYLRCLCNHPAMVDPRHLPAPGAAPAAPKRPRRAKAAPAPRKQPPAPGPQEGEAKGTAGADAGMSRPEGEGEGEAGDAAGGADGGGEGGDGEEEEDGGSCIEADESFEAEEAEDAAQDGAEEAEEDAAPGGAAPGGPALSAEAEEAIEEGGFSAEAAFVGEQWFPPSYRPDDLSYSAKVALLDRLLQAIRARAPGERVVICSNFTKTLDHIEALLGLRGLPSVRLDGSVSAAKRAAAVGRFSDPTSNIFAFLLSARAGGQGLNLMAANHMVLFDPDWNPAIDQQAMARVHRHGQKRPVFIYRLLTTGSIEEKIYQRQMNKQGLSTTVVDMGRASRGSSIMRRFSLEDLRRLFVLRTDLPSETYALIAPPGPARRTQAAATSTASGALMRLRRAADTGDEPQGEAPTTAPAAPREQPAPTAEEESALAQWSFVTDPAALEDSVLREAASTEFDFMRQRPAWLPAPRPEEARDTAGGRVVSMVFARLVLYQGRAPQPQQPSAAPAPGGSPAPSPSPSPSPSPPPSPPPGSPCPTPGPLPSSG